MRPPYFWRAGLDPKSREAAPLTRLLLTPLEQAYLFGFRLRWRRARPAPAPCPVICVGNVSVGGSGKTPLVAFLRGRIAEMGLRAASLSRGHGGALKGPVQVDPAVHTAAEVGDEPLMLAAHGESWIGRDRPATAGAMVAAGVEVIIMDDGFQTPSLEKTLSILVLDGDAGLGNGFCLPKGPLREPFASAEARADLTVVTGSGQAVPRAVLDRSLRAQIRATASAPEGPVVAFAGIGRPEKLFDSLKDAGADLREGVAFGDHYRYRRRDMSFLKNLASDHGARLVTTEKDLARLPTAWRDGILPWPVALHFEGDLAPLDAALAKALERDGDGK
ncbi:MAG: tetraacyldisaccharide 4'-kinase [Pseudomonadota bacterium]